jgi:2,3-bisphosphoglycerate-dependent phosphoglycerate mutase
LILDQEACKNNQRRSFIMQLYFIRHGQSSNNALYESTGSNLGRCEDPLLTPLGVQQASVLAEFLADKHTQKPVTTRNLHNQDGYHFSHIYTSPMVRAVATASILAEALKKPLTCWIDLHEAGGIFLEDHERGVLNGLPGKDKGYFSKHFANLILPEDFNERGWWSRPFEPYTERPARARRVLEKLQMVHGGKDDSVVFVSHGGFYNHILDALLGLPADDIIYFRLFNTGITRIDFEPDRTVLAYQNRINHLPVKLVTD